MPDADPFGAWRARVDAAIASALPSPTDEPRKVVQDVTLMALRALGVVDARARGLVVSQAKVA